MTLGNLRIIHTLFYDTRLQNLSETHLQIHHFLCVYWIAQTYTAGPKVHSIYLN